MHLSTFVFILTFDSPMKLKEQLDLQRKSSNPTIRDAALKSLTIYNAVCDLSEGHVWDSDWSTLVKLASCEGKFYWKPTKIGELVLRGIHSLISPLGDGYYDEEEEVGE